MLKLNFRKNYIGNENSRYGCQYLVSFCTKYKRNIFKEKDFVTLRTSFEKTAKAYNFEIRNIEITPNQVYMVIECDPNFGIVNAVIKLKKESKDYIRNADPSFKTKIPCIWTRETFISTIGSVTEKELRTFTDIQETYLESINKNKKES